MFAIIFCKDFSAFSSAHYLAVTVAVLRSFFVDIKAGASSILEFKKLGPQYLFSSNVSTLSEVTIALR